MPVEPFARPALELPTPLVGGLAVAAAPAGGQGLALDDRGMIPSALRSTLAGYEYGITEFTANVAITATTEGAADTIVTAPAITFDGGTAVWVEFWAVAAAKGTTSLSLGLFDGSTGIGGIVAGFATAGYGLSVRRKVTPTAGVHTFSARGWVDAGSGSVVAGSGGAATNLPGYIRIVRAA
jgi:hypothetical protein